MNDKQRSDYKNLILLCPIHHIETNDCVKYPVNALVRMKREHERNISLLYSGQNVISNHPSVISVIINLLGQTLLEDALDNGKSSVPSTDEKILYNNVFYYRPLIEEFSAYQGKLNSVYEEVENQGSSKKDFLLQNIKTLYLKEKGKYKSLEEIRKNADNIIESIESKLWDIVENSSNFNQALPIEALEMAISIIMVDGFMRCKILEEPIRA